MDPINILVALNFLLTFFAQVGGTKKGLKTSLSEVKERPATFLQKTPPNLLAIITLLTVLSIFRIGTLDYTKYSFLENYRLTGLLMYFVFSWLQIWAFKSMGDSYAHEIVIMKNHKLITSGPFKFIRHPQYLGQILSDIGVSFALLSYIILPIVIIFEIPLLIMRAGAEERLLAKHFGISFDNYKKKSGFFFPFIG
jgi:protein-S-isoprenylcysteine O-methyltransferase Ste14